MAAIKTEKTLVAFFNQNNTIHSLSFMFEDGSSEDIQIEKCISDIIQKREESKSGITYTFMSTIAEYYDCNDWIGRYLESGLAVKLPNACRDTVFYGRD